MWMAISPKASCAGGNIITDEYVLDDPAYIVTLVSRTKIVLKANLALLMGPTSGSDRSNLTALRLATQCAGAFCFGSGHFP
jgi:hypothetical protein